MVSWDAAADTSAAFRVFWWNKKGRRIGGGPLHLTSSNLGSGHRVSPTYTACCSLRLFSEVLPDKGWHFSPREAPVTWPWLRLQDKRRRHESIIIACHLHVRCTTFRQTQQLCEKEQVCKFCYLNECEVNNTSGSEHKNQFCWKITTSVSLFSPQPCVVICSNTLPLGFGDLYISCCNFFGGTTWTDISQQHQQDKSPLSVCIQ